MEVWLWFAVGFVVLVGVIVLEVRWKQGRRRSLSDKFKGVAAKEVVKNIPLGMEATDLAGFQEAMRKNGKSGFQGQPLKWRPFSHTAAHSHPPLPLPDDATYAARFHNAFGKTNKDENHDRS